MNKNERPSFLKRRGAAVGIVICFVAVIALVGVYTFNNYQKDIDEQMAKAEKQAEQLTEDKTEETTTDDIVLPEAGGQEDKGTASEENSPGTESGENGGQDSAGAGTGDADGAAASGADTSGVWFSEESVLTWPASGAVIMGYSMDQTVFFQTLEQYKYNPAMIISGEVGETITASAAGIVTDIAETAQTGTTVSLDMGNGYTAVYGQLTDVALSAGDYVNAGEKIGNLSEPTKYYSIEGPNLYFEILKDGEPVDPMNFME
ncbi:M23 family metallopeptidase [Lachnoclostridium sp. An76]|uniref:M23 family metallopeptidase n=1 Tax=Lachnoclostridium sp. An76 TaxID=1965654 RepID=UPI000B38DCB7|nr:M23 family metallopeptidase [Lachnoclostridium sp. An76]OUN34634.1 peptidase M23 [Lachnoclostridium sp. An76]